MKKLWLLVLGIATIVVSFVLSSGNIEWLRGKIEDETFKESGISDTIEYQKYKNLQSNGEINEDGLVKDDKLNNAPLDLDALDSEYAVTDGSVSVTFANSNIIDVQYYTNENFDTKFKNACFLEPQTHIYASIPRVKDEYTGTHTFSRFEVVVDGESRGDLETKVTDQYVTFSIPSNATSVVIIPKAGLNFINVYFDDYYIDEKADNINLFGTWELDGKLYDRNKPGVNIHAGKHIIKYNFNPNEYYVDIDLNEDVYSVDYEKGQVTFVSNNELSDFTKMLQLSKYVTVHLNNEFQKGLSEVKVNFELREIQDGTITGIKCGDKLQITVNEGYVLTSKKLINESRELLSNGQTTYTYIVPKESYNLSYELGISKGNNTDAFEAKIIDNASITVCYASTNNNEEISSADEISDSEKVVVTITPDTGYYITGKNVKDNVYQKTMEYKNYKKDIDSIILSHEIIKYVSLTLDSSDEYGKVTYKINGEVRTGRISNLEIGQKIELKYELTDSNYEIVRDANNPIDYLNNGWKNLTSKNKESFTILVDDSIPSPIKRSDYITIEKKGEK